MMGIVPDTRQDTVVLDLDMMPDMSELDMSPITLDITVDLTIVCMTIINVETAPSYHALVLYFTAL